MMNGADAAVTGVGGVSIVPSRLLSVLSIDYNLRVSGVVHGVTSTHSHVWLRLETCREENSWLGGRDVGVGLVIMSWAVVRVRHPGVLYQLG